MFRLHVLLTSSLTHQGPVWTINQVSGWWGGVGGGLQAGPVSVGPQSVSDWSVSGIKQQMDTREGQQGIISVRGKTRGTLQSVH